LLPSWCAPRRAGAIEVIGTALAAALGGAGYARIGADLGVPPGTVRGGCAACAPARRRCAASRCTSWARSAAPPRPSRSRAIWPLHDALNAVAAASHAAITGHGFGPAPRGRCWAASAWPATSCPLAPVEHPAPPWAPPCPQPGRDTDYERHGVTRAAHRDTREHHAVTLSTNRRSRAWNVRFYMLIVNVAAMLILSVAYSPGVHNGINGTSSQIALVGE